jgi:hypothetical protein
MAKVSREVWRAKYSGASAQHIQELFLDGQRAYFKGDYDAAMSDFMAAAARQWRAGNLWN